MRVRYTALKMPSSTALPLGWLLAGMVTIAGCVSSISTTIQAQPTGTPQEDCRQSRVDAPVDLPEGMDPSQAVSAYLDSGGDPAMLAVSLYDRGWVTPRSAFVHTDLDGDGDEDLAVGLTESPGAEGIAPSIPEGIADRGSVFLWRCEQGSYLLMEVAPPRPDFGLPALMEARDLTGDGLPELVVFHPLCGAHTCYAQYAVYQWDGTAMADRFLGDSTDLPSPEWLVHDEGQQRASVIEITAQGIGSIGAGPYRIWSRSWSWDPTRPGFIPTAERIEPPRFRIHALHDADDAFEVGDLLVSQSLYERVINDDTLLDWPAPGERRKELGAYAAYRRVLAFLAAGDAAGARAERYERLRGVVGPAAAYAELAELLLAADPAGGLAQACSDVQRYVLENGEAVLGPLDHGYANRTYSAADLCPAP